MGQRVLWVFRLEEEHEEALLMDILLKLSDMSIEKMPRDMQILSGQMCYQTALSLQFNDPSKLM